jgi:hypothetical protein
LFALGWRGLIGVVGHALEHSLNEPIETGYAWAQGNTGLLLDDDAGEFPAQIAVLIAATMKSLRALFARDRTLSKFRALFLFPTGNSPTQ